MNRFKTLCFCVLMGMAGHLHAQQVEDLALNAGATATVSATGATSASVIIDNGSSLSTIPLNTLTFTGGSATLTAAQVDSVRAAIAPSGIRSATLDLTDASGKVVKRYRLPVALAGGAAGGAPAAVVTPAGARKASVNDCGPAAEAWKNGNVDWKEGRSALVLFTASGQYCSDRSARVVRQGDDIYVGVLSREDDTIQKVDVQFTPCDAESAEPNIYISSKVPSQFAAQAAGNNATLNIYDVRRCYSATTKVSATITPGPGVTPISAERSLNLNARYRGTLQIGALYTDLHKNSFDLRDSGGQKLIYNKEAEENGPEYVANVLVYGLPRYLTADGWRGGYRGRDILNDYDWRDRLGLVFSAGLDDPGDRFGVGLAFEIAYGINVFYTKHWYRQRELVGLQPGDAFTGAADTLPVQRTWDADSSWGISFDLRYLTALFDRM